MQIKEKERAVDCSEAESVDDEKGCNLVAGDLNCAGNKLAGQSTETEVKKKLERIDIKEDDEQQDAGEETGEAVIEPVTAAELVVAVPDEREEEEANRESRKATHGVDEIVKLPRHIERDHEQGESKTENGVAESFETTDLEAALAKAIGHFTIVSLARAARNMERLIQPESAKRFVDVTEVNLERTE